MIKISKLDNPVQEYAWGSETAIQDLLGEPAAKGKPMAELWMGAHVKAPSRVMIDGEWKTLNKVINTSPEAVLGERVAEKFSGRLPFLFKILAIARPLSIQVHPDFGQAREGFARENMRGIPLDAPNRNYRDENHKPEILCALTPFQGLIGFRSTEEILDLMNEISSPGLSEMLGHLKKCPDSNGLKRFFTSLMTINKTRRRLIVSKAADIAEKRSGKEPVFHWIAELNRAYSGDMGIFSPAILNLVELEPGEALYIPAGELHAYLDGVGIELMANSDNVLRGGLTPKHMDIPELLRIVNFKSMAVSKIKPQEQGDLEEIYPAPSKEFVLSVISLKKGTPFTSTRNRSVEILICMEGKADIRDLESGDILPLNRGESVIVPAVVSRYRIEGKARLYKASVPNGCVVH